MAPRSIDATVRSFFLAKSPPSEVFGDFTALKLSAIQSSDGLRNDIPLQEVPQAALQRCNCPIVSATGPKPHRVFHLLFTASKAAVVRLFSRSESSTTTPAEVPRLRINRS